MDNEKASRKEMSKDDLLSMITKDQLVTEAEKFLLQSEAPERSAEEVANEAMEAIRAKGSGMIVDKAVFEVIRAVLTSLIPKDTENDSGQFTLNILDGQPNVLHENETKDVIRDQIVEIYHSLVGGEPDQNFSSNILAKAFLDKSKIDPLQKILFVKNYGELAIDIREKLHWLIKDGISVYVAFEKGEEMPTDAYMKLSEDFITSPSLKKAKKPAPNLILRNRPENQRGVSNVA
jgi:hypothetical protein